MANEQNEQNKETTQQKVTLGDKIGCTAIIALAVLFIGSCCNMMTENTPLDTSANDKNVISKSSFQGEWPFKTDNVKLYCEKIDSSGLTGAKVAINGNTYAVTRNLENKYTFLPYNEWADVKMDGLLCNGVYIEKQCKVNLTDIVNFADTLCN